VAPGRTGAGFASESVIGETTSTSNGAAAATETPS
jgi:hypothetical protein